MWIGVPRDYPQADSNRQELKKKVNNNLKKKENVKNKF
jgi:hypothetical protein